MGFGLLSKQYQDCDFQAVQNRESSKWENLTLVRMTILPFSAFTSKEPIAFSCFQFSFWFSHLSQSNLHAPEKIQKPCGAQSPFSCMLSVFFHCLSFSILSPLGGSALGGSSGCCHL